MKTMNKITQYFTKQLISIFFLGILSGMPLALVGSSLSVWLSEYSISKTMIGIFIYVNSVYSMKFLWSPFMDHIHLPILGNLMGRRRSWILLTQLIQVGLIALISQFSPNSGSLLNIFGLGMAIAFTSATADIAIDAYRVESLKPESQGNGAFMAIFGYRIGMLITSAIMLIIAHYTDWKLAFLVISATTLLLACLIFLMPEPKQPPKSAHVYRANFVTLYIEPLADFLKNRNWLLILLFILFYKFGDAFLGAMTSPFLIETGFNKLEIAKIVKTYGFVATLLGTFTAGLMIQNLGTIKTLWIAGILQLVSNLLFIYQAHMGHDNNALTIVMSFENFAGGIGGGALVAYLASLCNISYTASQYALLSSISTLGRNFLASPAGFVASNTTWINFFVISSVLSIPGLLFLYYMVKNNKQQKLGRT